MVVDEGAGQLLALSAIPAGAPWLWVVLSFALFRFFDILKLGPVGWADRRKGVFWVMFDDLMAGAMAAGATLACLRALLPEGRGLMLPEATLDAARALLAEMEARRLTLATAESCTGGLIAAALTAIAGSSAVVTRGYVTYSNEAKAEMLGVPAELFGTVGAVSEEVARAMAEGALRVSGAGMALSCTGIAGPGGATPGKPVGLVYHRLRDAGGADAGGAARLPRRPRGGARGDGGRGFRLGARARSAEPAAAARPRSGQGAVDELAHRSSGIAAGPRGLAASGPRTAPPSGRPRSRCRRRRSRSNRRRFPAPGCARPRRAPRSPGRSRSRRSDAARTR